MRFTSLSGIGGRLLARQNGGSDGAAVAPGVMNGGDDGGACQVGLVPTGRDSALAGSARSGARPLGALEGGASRGIDERDSGSAPVGMTVHPYE